MERYIIVGKGGVGLLGTGAVLAATVLDGMKGWIQLATLFVGLLIAGVTLWNLWLQNRKLRREGEDAARRRHRWPRR